jgi:Protein of unknown function (DUF1592)/Protein of unknown function (DUF1588)/Protein of unknown function (DUF1595)/Protein of unknown function (DUF1587)
MGTTVLHRLNQVELKNTLSALFGPQVLTAVPERIDPLVQGFDTNADVLTVSAAGVDSFFVMAEAIAAKVSLSQLGDCSGQERTCADQRVRALAPRVLRRPATAAELSSFLALWDDVRSREDATAATRAVVQRLLLTPDFLYHVEVGDPATGKLTPYELAARLAYLAWESTPDQALVDAAANGGISTPEGVATQLTRLLADPQGRAVYRRFFELWGDLGRLQEAIKDPALYPGFDALKAPMLEEYRRTIDGLISEGGTVKELFTSKTTYVDATLAAFYGLPAPPGGVQRVEGTRPGILTRGAFLAIHGKANKSSPILRGVFIRDRVLCAPLPPPPPGVNTSSANAAATSTTRAFYENLTSPSTCTGCHGAINPLGFALEGFDGQGGARSSENGFPIDSSGQLTAGDRAGPVSGAQQLAELLGESITVRNCLVRNWFRSRFRRFETGGDEALINAVAAQLAADGDQLRGLALALARHEALDRPHYRIPHPSEVTP